MWFEPSHVEAVRDTFPEWMAFLFAFFSYLGSVWFVAPAVVLAFWFGNRRRFAPWLATVVGGYAIMVGFKGFFQVGRPEVGPAIAPETLPIVLAHIYAPLVEVSSSSFPSGHAIAGTIIWSMFALESSVGTRRQRFLAAGTMITLISFSRIAVGLHYPSDVVAGVAIALAYLSLILSVRRWARQTNRNEIRVVFTLVAVISLVSLLIGGRYDAGALMGGTIGSVLAWQYAEPSPVPWKPDVRGGTRAIVGIGFLSLSGTTLIVSDTLFVWVAVGLVSGLIIVGLPQLFVAVSETRAWSYTTVGD